MATIRSDGFRTYLETFHCVYREKLDAYVPVQYHSDFLRIQHLQDSKIVGYVSTTYGIGMSIGRVPLVAWRSLLVYRAAFKNP